MRVPSLPRTSLGRLQTVSLIYFTQPESASLVWTIDVTHLRLSLVEFDCASNPDDFPLEFDPLQVWPAQRGHLFGCDVPSGRPVVSACHFGVGSASLGVASAESISGCRISAA